MHLGANTVDELRAAVGALDEVDEGSQLRVDAVEAVCKIVSFRVLRIWEGKTHL